jgi:Carboxypeptidase regulatory-like domain
MHKKLSVIICAILLLTSTLLAQQQLATVKITVADPSGAVLPGATLTLKSMETGAQRTAVTEDNGSAVLAGVPAGAYNLTAQAKQFNPRIVPVMLSVGQIASVTVTLGLSTREESVNVQATAEGIDVEKADVSQVIDTPKISDLPIQGRDFIDFVLLTPSVNVGRSTAVGAQSPFTETVLKLSFGGVRESHSSFFALDGIDYTTSISGVQRISPSQDWVQEFRVVDSPYTADTGRNLGSVVNTITKSGTNDLHGSLYEFFRNNKMDANNLLSAPGFNTYRFNQFGGTVGGPIRKQKNFFFAGYEGQRSAESPIYSQFILNCIDESSPRFSQCPLSNPFVIAAAKLPGPESINDVKKSLGLQPENLSSILQIDDYDKFITKINNVLSDHTQLNFTYLFNDSRKRNVRGAAPGEGLPSSYRNNPVRDQTVSADLVHLLSERMTSETLVQYGRRVFHLDPVGEGFEPALNIPNLLFSGGFVGSVHFYQEQHFQVAENVTLTHGNHTFKFGGEFQPVWTDAQVPLFTPGFGVFPPDAFFGTADFFGTGDFSAADSPFGPGTPVLFLYLIPRTLFGQPIANRDPNFQAGLYTGADAQKFIDGTSLSYTHKLWSMYWQDQWKARPNLSFTFGLHYDVDFMPDSQELKFQCASGAPSNCAHPTKYNNVQPRFGFAYSFNGGKGVVRGGTGIFVGPFVYSDILVSWIGASEFTYMNNPLVPQLRDPAQQLIGFGASGAVGVPTPFLASPALHNFIATGAYPVPLPNPGGVPTPEFPLGYAQRDFNNPFAEMASLEIEHQIGKDWYATIGYQYLHASRLPVYRSINGTPAGFTSDGKQLYTPADPTFGFALMVNPIGYSLYNAGTVSVRKNLSHHYNLLANYTYSKSIDIATTVNLPATPQDYLNPSADRAVGDNDVRHRFTLAFLAESPKEWPRLLRDFKFSMLNTLQSARYFTILAGFDVNNDIFPFNDRVDNIPRNTYKGDPYYGTDLRLQRVFPITERMNLEASAEAFNVLNRVNVQDINHAYGAPVFTGPVPQHFGDGITNAAGFGTPKFVDPARQIQLSVRLNF